MSNEAQQLAKAINDAMERIDENMSATDFAVAVAHVLKEEYGNLAIKDFMLVLKTNLS